MRKNRLPAFEEELMVSSQDIEWSLLSMGQLDWLEFWLNPRRLRGADFLMRWSQGVWSENRMIEAVNVTDEFFAFPYGPSSVAPSEDVRAFELYFERLDEANPASLKRPDLLVFRAEDRAEAEELTERFGGSSEFPFLDEEILAPLVTMSVVAIECENSLWKARQMPDYAAQLKPQKCLGGQLGLKKNAVLPTVILKEEDRQRLLDWQIANKKAIHIWHSFYDEAYGLSLGEAQNLISKGQTQKTEQVFQAPGGATTAKIIYKFLYHFAYPIGTAIAEPQLLARAITDKNGHILPYVTFEGGSLKLRDEVLDVLRGLIQ